MSVSLYLIFETCSSLILDLTDLDTGGRQARGIILSPPSQCCDSHRPTLLCLAFYVSARDPHPEPHTYAAGLYLWGHLYSI